MPLRRSPDGASPERQKSGLGPISKQRGYETGLAVLHPQPRIMSGMASRRAFPGNEHPLWCPTPIFQQDRRLFIASAMMARSEKLAQEIGKTNSAPNPRFASNTDRIANAKRCARKLPRIPPRHEAKPVGQPMLAGACGRAFQKLDQALTNRKSFTAVMSSKKEIGNGCRLAIRLARSKPSLRRKPPKFSRTRGGDRRPNSGISKGSSSRWWRMVVGVRAARSGDAPIDLGAVKAFDSCDAAQRRTADRGREGLDVRG